MENLEKARTMEEELAKIIAGIKADILAQIPNKPAKGVTVTGSHCATVFTSTVMRSNGMILNPCYYLPQAQVDAVEKDIAGSKNYSSLIKNLNAMVTRKKTKDGTLLNDATLSVLKTCLQKQKEV